MKTKFFIVLIIFTLSVFSDYSWADTIYLKNGNQIEGIIDSESDDSITINVGIGKFTVSKSDVESIEHTSKEERDELLKDWKKKDIEKGNYAPPGLFELSEKFKELKETREKVEIERDKLNNLKEEFEIGKSKMDKLITALDIRSKDLKNMSPDKDVQAYNKVVSEINSLNASLVAVSNEVKKINDKSVDFSRNLHKAITTYKNNMDKFRVSFQKEVSSIKKEEITEDEEYFFETIKRDLSIMDNDFKKDIVSASRAIGKSLVVEVTLNQRVSTLMVVDSGADIVTITAGIADQLGIDLSTAQGEADITLADGSKSKAKLIHLESVEVGDSKAENVLAAVMDNPPASGVDGLLGMSFLNNFDVKIDAANNKLILESLQEQ